MAERPTVDVALARLTAAIDRLDAAINHRLDTDRAITSLEEELQRLGEDRSRLAQDLDQQAARAGRLEDANREVSRRLVAAMEAIRAVLERGGG